MSKIFGRDKILNCTVTQKKRSYSIPVNQKKMQIQIHGKLKRIVDNMY